MRRSGFRIPRLPARRGRALIPRLGRLEGRVLLSGSVGHADVAGQQAVSRIALAKANRQAITSGALIAPGVHGYDPTNPVDPSAPPLPSQLLTTQDVSALLERAAAAVNVNGAIIAVVDRNGTILGVRVEGGVSPDVTGNTTNLVFAVDGAVSLARTGTYFANEAAPLTSRTIQEISQTTITQREVDSNPDVPSDNGTSTLYGPGFVAPVGIKGHFPPGIMFTPQVDLFDIESTNRDSISPITGTRFNVPPQYIPAGAESGCPRVVRTGDRHSAHGPVAGDRDLARRSAALQGRKTRRRHRRLLPRHHGIRYGRKLASEYPAAR